MNQTLKKSALPLLLGIMTGLLGVWIASAEEKSESGASPADHLPAYITRLTEFGERADWNHDGKRILFLEKTFGDVFEIEVETKTSRP